MKRLFNRKTKWGLALLLVGALLAVALPALAARLQAPPPNTGLACLTGTTFNLRAAEGRVVMPDGNSIYIWGFTDRASGPAELPGPALCVNQGATVTVNLTNDLPMTYNESVSISFPGQSNVMVGGAPVQPQYNISGTLTSLTNAAAPGTAISYSFVAGQPGTYLYESGTNPHKQVQMGLFGALIVRPTAVPGNPPGSYAYNDVSTQFDPQREYLLLFHEFDPYLHAAVEANQQYDSRAYRPRYWTINGRPFPDALAPNGAPWLPDQPYGALVQVEPYDATNNPLPALLRIANAGMENHPFHPHGNHHRVIAHDGRLLGSPGSGGPDESTEKFTIVVGSGQTYDALFQWYDVEGWNELTNPVPVTVPQLQNQVFEGSWYSGSPYLGETGDLPVGTTVNNECGEYYFMWHTHAAYGLVNWNDGPGGMITWLRVDPAGGCP
jgi:FtsP/CotA-like multicopper oxidase with cupredoxin domain